MLSIDLQKALDISWPYLFGILVRWGFGPKFLGILHSLYSNPSAQIRFLGRYSDAFQIEKVTRQGCPLSPLFSSIAIETLVIARFRNHLDIKGVLCHPQEHRCALFADNLLLFVTSSLISTPNIFQLLQDFVSVSGLQVNISKSKALNISVPTSFVECFQTYFPFTLSSNSIPYLGIRLSSAIANLYTVNFPPMFKKTRESFDILV